MSLYTACAGPVVAPAPLGSASDAVSAVAGRAGKKHIPLHRPTQQYSKIGDVVQQPEWWPAIKAALGTAQCSVPIDCVLID